MTRWKWLLLAACGLLLVGSVAAFTGSGLNVEVVQVRRGILEASIDEEGKTHLPNVYRVFMPFSGQLAPINWEEGQSVSTNELLAEVSPKQLQENVNESLAVVERLEASLAENADEGLESTTRQQAIKFVESMASTVEAAREQLTSSRERVDFTETVLGRMASLIQSKAVNREDYDRAQLNHVEAQVSYRQDNLLLKSITAIQAATSLVPGLVDDYLTKKQLQRSVLQAQKREAEARWQQAAIRQQQGRLTSPISGTILEKHASGNEMLAPGELLMVLGDLEQLEVETEILTEDALQVDVGDPVELSSLSNATREPRIWPGTVKQISPAGFTKLSSLGVEQQRVEVRIELSDETRQQMLSEGIRVGYRLDVRMITDRVENALLVPRTALFRDDKGNWSVFVVVGRRARQRPVEVGLMNDQNAQILEGLQENDEVIVTPDPRLANGDRVSVELLSR